MSAAQRVLSGLAPVIDTGCRALVLGSFPGEASLAAGHYYAHPRNQFWALVGDALGEPLRSLPFDARYQRLLAHGLGLWDVITRCRRQGSLDTAIRAAEDCPPTELFERAPALRTVLLNGRLAHDRASRWHLADVRLVALPSSSPANARLDYLRKLEVWRPALQEALAR